MTTLLRINVEAPLPSVDDNAKFETDYAKANRVASSSSRITFMPVSTKILYEIIGYITLGLSEMSLTQESIPFLLFKWSTWLTRMNKWMTDNAKIYPKYMELPDAKVSANLYFLGNVKPTDTATILFNASTASLGPLFPQDINTILHALNKGIEKNSLNYQTNQELQQTFTQFINDVQKLSLYAINTETSHRIKTIPAKTDNLPIVVPIPHMGKDDVISKPSLKLIEKFTDTMGLSQDNWDKCLEWKNSIPMWAYVAILVIIIYYFTNKSSSDDEKEPIKEWLQKGGKMLENLRENGSF